MIIFNKDRMKELNNIPQDDIYILTDFDGTITKDSSDSSWASIFKNPNVSSEFVQECIRIFEFYHKYEIDEKLALQDKISMMKQWYIKNIETLKRFRITEEIINYSANNESIMSFREGAKDFLREMSMRDIPIIIISAGVGNIIQQFLINNESNYDNIYICSNFLEYDNGVITGVRDDNLIHPLNKNEISLPAHIKVKLANRNNALLLGNSIADIQMASSGKNVYKIGFLDEKIAERLQAFEANYDIVCTDNTSYTELKNEIRRLQDKDIDER